MSVHETAKEISIGWHSQGSGLYQLVDAIEAALLAERERCAKIAENYGFYSETTRRDFARAIRSDEVKK